MCQWFDQPKIWKEMTHNRKSCYVSVKKQECSIVNLTYIYIRLIYDRLFLSVIYLLYKSNLFFRPHNTFSFTFRCFFRVWKHLSISFLIILSKNFLNAEGLERKHEYIYTHKIFINVYFDSLTEERVLMTFVEVVLVNLNLLEVSS